MSSHIFHKVWGEIIYPFPNFNGSTVGVWECINNFIPRFIIDVITYPWRDLSYSMLVKRPLVVNGYHRTKSPFISIKIWLCTYNYIYIYTNDIRYGSNVVKIIITTVEYTLYTEMCYICHRIRLSARPWGLCHCDFVPIGTLFLWCKFCPII